MKKVVSIVVAITVFVFSAVAQIRKTPALVTAAFEKQYPTAQDVEYKDLLASIHVHFVLDSIKMIARYNSKGEWKETEKEWSFDKFAPEVQDGFQKSKYADEWKVKEA